MRVTSQSMINQSTHAARRLTQQVGEAQQQITTGLRVNKGSDDPLAMRGILAQKALDSRLQVQLGNIRDSNSRLDVSVSQLLDAKNLLVAAKDVALESSVTFEGDVLADQVDQIIQRMEQIANQSYDGEYLFSGAAAADTRPFEWTGQGNADRTLRYVGADIRSHVVVGISLTVDVLYSGNEVFQQQKRAATEFAGPTGAAAGVGTDNATGRGQLVVRHVSTTFAGGSGIQPGSSSAGSDTLIGSTGANQLTIVDTSGTGASGTLSLNGAAPVAFTSGDTNLRVTGPKGQTLYVDTTAITGGFNGTVDVTANGTISIDGGITETAINFSAGQILTDSRTGQVTHVDSTQISRTGIDRVVYNGTADVFQTLKNLRDDLRSGSFDSQADRSQALNQIIGDLDRHIGQVTNVVGEQAATLENLRALEQRHEDLQLESRRILGELESADLPTAVTNLQNAQNLLQFTYASTSRLYNLSILNYL